MAKSKKNSPVSTDDHSNRRRFPRVSIKNDLENARALVGAELEWPGSSESKVPVFDISYSGAAVEKPKGASLKEGQDLKVKMLLGDMEAFEVPSKVKSHFCDYQSIALWVHYFVHLSMQQWLSIRSTCCLYAKFDW